ncbi:hypothetical protein ACRRTK_004397 [Alexandromys fortis]
MEVPNVKDFQWKRLAPLPSRRVYCSLLETGGQVYAIGGCDDNGVPMDCFEVYSPEADQWTSLPSLPTARAGVAVTALGKRIMVIGGVGTNQLPLKVVEMYNIDEGKWKKRSVLREAAMGISVTAKDYRVYAAGGMGLDLRPHNYLQHYDMLKDMWVSLAPMPTPRYAATSFLRGSKIYVLGGRQSKYAVNAFEVFDIESRSWTKFPNIPCKRAFSSFVTLDNHLYSLGGLRQGRLYRQPKFLRTMDVFDMEQGTFWPGWLFLPWPFLHHRQYLYRTRGMAEDGTLVLPQEAPGGLRGWWSEWTSHSGWGTWEPAHYPGNSRSIPPGEEQVGDPPCHAHTPLCLLQHRLQELPPGCGGRQPGSERCGGGAVRL